MRLKFYGYTISLMHWLDRFGNKMARYFILLEGDLVHQTDSLEEAKCWIGLRQQESSYFRNHCEVLSMLKNRN